MITRERALSILSEFGACQRARDWFQYFTIGDPESAWNRCSEPDWLVWLAVQLRIDHVVLTRTAYECAKSISHLIPENVEWPQKALKFTEQFLNDKEVSWSELKEITEQNISYEKNTEFLSLLSVRHLAQTVLYHIDENISAIYRSFGYIFDYVIDARTLNDESIVDLAHIVREHVTWQMIEEKIEKL